MHICDATIEFSCTFVRYADRVKELGASEGGDEGPKMSPEDYDPDSNGAANYSRLASFNVSVDTAPAVMFTQITTLHIPCVKALVD